MRKKVIQYVTLGLAISIVVAVAFRYTRHDKPNIQYVTAQVSYQDIESTVEAVGTIRAADLVSVGAQVNGQIKSMHVTLGDHVRKGQLIAEIDSQPQIYALDTARAQLQSAVAAVHSSEASLVQARLALRRQKELAEHDAGSHADLETTQAAFDVARANVETSHAQMKVAQVNVDTARVTLGYTRIVAPSDGEVVAVLAVEGQTVNANQTTPNLVKIARLDTIQVKAQISEADVVRLRPGLPAYFTILGDPSHRYETTLKAIEPAPDSIMTDTTTSPTTTSSATNTAIYYIGRLDMPNPDHRLRISMTAQVSVVLARARHVAVLPVAALTAPPRDGRATVRVLAADGNVTSRIVRTGIANDTVVQIVSGLGAGDRVVVGQSSGAGPRDPYGMAG
ncbi:efflux RND transporter periplasmic adaptor subunit [Burkholderia seminalis]|uniref:efflux RND transporter periplasmic adaptor subunit n=1 Tax=Burkholderia seminalis TaxID=488731 RepID=UPI0006650B2D|nr:efflux RND transporter periplasmic adaptor subunit [Burkholderia seminalis]MBJ9592902.1 efflux RND transporter periplasmic adaptor subunit [Burkholderia seminalis]RQS86184.1 efflux RND transporter periplasmic adaptor subunit [Burkholderia seminalis]